MSDYTKLVKGAWKPPISELSKLQKERDELAAHVEFLTAAFEEVLNKVADNDSRHYYLNIINCTPAASLLLHDARVLEALRLAMDDFDPKDSAQFMAGQIKCISMLDDALGELRKQAEKKPAE